MEERRRLGEVLVAAGILTADQLEEVVAKQSEVGGPKHRLGLLVAELGLATEEEIAMAVASQVGLEYMELGRVIPDPELADLIPRRLADHHLLVALRRDSDGAVVVAMADPADVLAIDDLKMTTGATDVRAVVSTISSIRAAIRRAYGIDSVSESPADTLLRPGQEDDSTGTGATEDLDAIRRQLETAPIVQLVNDIFKDAVMARATDIHIEPRPIDVRVRYRVDGVLREATILQKRLQGPVLSRVKILSGMDISERRRPQDGRGRLRIEGRNMDSRVSTIPTAYGEKVVIRLLPEGEEFVPLEHLGFDDEEIEIVKRYLGMPQGLIIFTGPQEAGRPPACTPLWTRSRVPRSTSSR